MSEPNATLMLRRNGGVPQDGGVVGALNDSIQLTALDKSGWGVPVTRWDIFDYPPGFAQPAGWQVDASGVYFHLGSLDPPPWTATLWGDYALRLTILDSLVDERTRVRILSPSGLRDHARGEDTHFGGPRVGNVDAFKRNLRVIEASLVGGGGGPGAGSSDAIPNTSFVRDANADGAVRYLTAQAIVGPVACVLSAAGGSYIEDSWRGPGGAQTRRRFHGRIQTSGAVSAVVFDTPPIGDGLGVEIEFSILANTNGTQAASYRRIATYRVNGGAATLIASTPVHTAEDNAAWNVMLGTAGNRARVLVTGAAGADIAWECYATVLYCGGYVP